MDTAKFVVAGGGKLETGKIYEVHHSRKGVFDMKVDKINGEWATGTITKGKAKMISRVPDLEVGDGITVRDTLSYFVPVPENENS